MSSPSILLIHSATDTPRLRYALDILCTQLLGIGYQLESNPDKPVHLRYAATDGPGMKMNPHGLLSEQGVRQDLLKEVRFESWGTSHACFRTAAEELPFDLLAATFFLCSRYEEYLDFYPDEHDRFTPRESVLFQADLLEEPLVNQWALLLRDRLQTRFPELRFAPRAFQFTSTVDIDQTWKYRRKGWKRNFAGFFRDLLQGKWENLKERWPVFWRLRPDPFFNFDWQHQLHAQNRTAVHYFFLLGDRGTWDKNIRYSDPKQNRLIRDLHQMAHCKVGIHPSYATSQLINREDPQAMHFLRMEIERLSQQIGSVDSSRQHFLLHRFPHTPELLEHLGIREEHSMGYSSMAGFRAGIAAPFPFYDLRRETSTDLIQVPFALMDITPLHYLEMSPPEAIAYMRGLMRKVKEVGGLFVSLWHNESLSETERWKGWRILYEEMIKEAAA